MDQSNQLSLAIVAKPVKVAQKRNLPPMLQQYCDYKQQYPEHVILFQVGDFYEIFFEDAEVVSQTLNIRLTSRDKNQDDPIQMCGVPLHAASNYLPKLLAAGFSCVVVDQLEEASLAKGMVKRGVTRIVTPGTRYEEDGLEERSYNFLASVLQVGDSAGALCYADVSAGLIRIEEVQSEEELQDALERINAVEVILPTRLDANSAIANLPWRKRIKSFARAQQIHVIERPFRVYFPKDVIARTQKIIGQKVPVATELEKLSPEVCATVISLLDYLEEISFDHQPTIHRIQVIRSGANVVIDAATRRNLELFETRIDGEKRNSLFSHLDKTRSAMGSRLLADWIGAPSKLKSELEERQNAVEFFVAQAAERETLRTILAEIRDLERLTARVSSGRANPIDLKRLELSLFSLPRITQIISKSSVVRIQEFAEKFDTLSDLYERLQQALVDEPPLRMSDGGIFRKGYSEELDSLMRLASEHNQVLLQLEASEKVKSGINNLKIKYNNVQGYFIEVTKAQSSKVPAHFQRKQTLTNAERFVTDELRQLEQDLNSAKHKQVALEQELFRNLRELVASHLDRIQLTATVLAELDVFAALAQVACERNYVKPLLTDKNQILIRSGRHPVVEQLIGAHAFVPNHTNLAETEHRFAILTGPNMGGKSTYLRQVGLIQLLAQIGSFVPVETAELGIVDRIFTRIGTADDITRGDSTFMVEMREASTILRKSTTKSLVLIDEIGRGTATADGLALARAIAEWLHDAINAKVIFATHFHELTELTNIKQRMFCISVGVIEENDGITFSHHIEDRAASRSYGLEVARLAGLPEELLARASVLLAQINNHEAVQVSLAYKSNSIQVSQENDPFIEVLRNVAERIRLVDLQRTTPLEALNQLAKLREMLER